MGRKAGRHGKAGEGHADHVGFANEDANVVEIGTILGQPARLELAEAYSRLTDSILPFRDDQDSIAGRQRKIRSRKHVVPALANHGYLDAFRKFLGDILEPAAGEFLAD